MATGSVAEHFKPQVYEALWKTEEMIEAQVHKSLSCSLGNLGQINNPQKYPLTIWMSESC